MKKDKKINESLIGRIIYGFLMFAPLLAIMFTSLYATFNPNAKDSYSGTQTQIEVRYQYKTNEINSIEDLIEGNIYKVNTQIYSSTSITLNCTYLKFNRYTNVVEYKLSSLQNDYLRLIVNGTSLYVYSYQVGTYLNTFVFSTLDDYFYIVYKTSTINNLPNNLFSASDYLGEQIIEEKEAPGTLDNAFYYALDKTEESTLFNWSKNTGIYTVLYNACNGLGITATFIPFILTYWLFISLIYLIYDLVLVFVHIAHKKVHELEDF